jgi:hypothetical protein
MRETVVAAGTTPVAGPWRITSHASKRIVANGETVQEEGLPCVRLFLLRRPARSPFAGSGQCGAAIDGFGISSVPVMDEFGRVEVILWGRAPDDATAVELRADGTGSRAGTLRGPPGFDGDVWVLPSSPDLTDPTLAWIDSTGRPHASTRAVASELARGRALRP